MKRTVALVLTVFALYAAVVWALHSGKDIIIPAASRGAGSGTSVWATALYITNPGTTNANVTLYWLVRNQANPNPPLKTTILLRPGETYIKEDALLQIWGLTSGAGAIRVTSDATIVVNATILNRAGGTEFGQGSEGIPVEAAIKSGSTTQIMGLKNTTNFRTNVFFIDALGGGSEATVTLTNEAGSTIATKNYVLGAYEPKLESMSVFGAPTFENATAVVKVTKGAILCGASRVNNSAGDPITLAAWWPLPNCSSTTITAPSSLVGRHMKIMVDVPGMGTMTHNVYFATATSGTFTDQSDEVPFTYSAYASGPFTAASDKATIKISVPLWSMTMDLAAVGTSAKPLKGTITGSGESPIGHEEFNWTFEFLD